MPKLTIEQVNLGLERVKVLARGNKLYLRATLPVKQGKGTKQQEVSTKLPNTSEGLKIAKLKAQKLENDLNLDAFNWADWINIAPEGQLPVQDAVKGFEQFYWETRRKTPAREDDYINLYQRYLKLLPQGQLTPEMLRKTLVSFEVDSYARSKAYLVYSALAKWAKIELPQDWKFLKGKYKVTKDRVIPSDLEIEELFLGIKHEGWAWVFAMLATYGLRPHEVFHLNLDKFPVIQVKQATKTGARLVYPLYPHWVEVFNLKQACLPNINTNKSNKDLGARVSQNFYVRKMPIVPYSLRDAYAIRGAKLGIDSLIMSKWMGHSVDVHSKHYMAYIDEVSMERIWQQATGSRLRVISKKEGIPSYGEH